MSAKGGLIFVVITAGAWILVLFVLIHRRVTETSNPLISDLQNTKALANPTESKTLLQPHEGKITKDEVYVPKTVLEEVVVPSDQISHISAKLQHNNNPHNNPHNNPQEEVLTNHAKVHEKMAPTTKLSTTSPIKNNDNYQRSAESYQRTTTWEAFVSSSQEPLRPSHNFTKPRRLLLCEDEVIDKLNERLGKSELDWCKWALSPSGGSVQVGKSYGKLNQGERTKYEQYNCNSVAKGENPSCDDVWGDSFVKSWKKNIPEELCGDSKLYSSNVICRDSPHLARFCVFENIAMDFTKMQNVVRPGRTDTRKWTPGFLTTHCDVNKHADIGYYEMYRPTVSPSATKCSHVIDETILVYGHDDIKNLGHSMSDFMNVWTMLWLAGLGDYAHDIAFFNMDAIRMGHNYHDDLGTFSKHYESQFSKVLKASSFPSDAMVCVKRLIFMPRPLILFTWDGWWTDMKCSFVGPSSLFQRWNTQVRNNYGILHQNIEHPQGKIRVLVIKRSTKSSASMYTSRVIRNMDEIEKGLIEINDADVIVQDLGGMSMEEQVKLIASVGIIVGVHGAGIPNSMHMSIGSELCCGVIEIFPQGEFSAIRGYGNMVRRMGMHYQRMELRPDDSQSSGATVSVSALKSEIVKMMGSIRTKPTCVLPSVMDDPYFDSVAPMIRTAI